MEISWNFTELNDWFCPYDALVGGLEHFFIFPYLGNNHPN